MSPASGVDMAEMRRLTAHLERILRDLPAEVDKVTKRGVHNLKNAYIDGARGSAHFNQISRTISYEQVASGVSTIGWTVGPDPRRGSVAQLAGAYFGWPNGGGGTLDLDGPLRAEEPRFLDALVNATVDVVVRGL